MRRFNATERSDAVIPLLLTALAAALTLLPLVPQEAYAQSDRYVAFAHGISFGDDRPSANDQSFQEAVAEKASRWKASGTPQAWKDAGVIDGYVFLKYFDRDLYGGSRDWTWDSSREDMMARFVDHMKAKAPSDARWMLVGHSQGGIVVRLLHEYIRANHPEIDVEGVMAVASPLQGARAARISWDGEGDYYSVSSEIINFLQDVLGAPITDMIETGLFAANIQPYGGSRWIELGSNVFDFYEYLVHNGIREAAEANWLINADGKIDDISYNKRGAAAIAPGGYLIQQINSGPTPDQYRALIGAERYPVPFRVWSGASTDRAFSSFPWFPLLDLSAVTGAVLRRKGYPSAGALFYGIGSVPEIRPGDEPTTVNYYNNIVLQYNATEQHYDSQNSGWNLWYDCWNGDGYNPCTRQDRWHDGAEALENFPGLYGKLIDSYQLERRTDTYQRTVCPTTGSGYRVAQSRFTPPTAEEYINAALEPPDPPGGDDDSYDGGGNHGQDDDDGVSGNECWKEWVTDVYYVTVPDDNDGIVSEQTGVWSEGDSPNDRNHNFLFDDDGGGQNSTGYNHAEMVYNRRRYDSSRDPAYYNISFQRGDLNPPMVNARNWIREEVFGAPN